MILLDRRVLRDRRERVSALVREAGHDALLVFAQGSSLGSNAKSHGYMRFLADWDGYNTNSVLLVIPGQDPILLVSNIFLKFMSEGTRWVDDVRMSLPPTLARDAAHALKERLPACKRLALTGRAEMPVPFWDSLRDELGAGVTLTDAEALIDPLRMVKDTLQYTIHGRGAELCDDMFQELRRRIHTSLPVYRLQAAVEKIARDAGAEHVLTWLTVGPAANYCHFRREECQRVPMPGDQVLLGIYLLYQGHWAHAIRMGTYGTPNPAQERAFDIVLQMQNEALAALTPGGNLYDVNHAFDRVLQQHFTPDALKNIFFFRHAHGLGHSYEDPITSTPFPQPYGPRPAVASDARIEILPGMLFEFHPNFFEKNVAGATLGDMVYVTEHGPEIMTRFPREHVRWDL